MLAYGKLIFYMNDVTVVETLNPNSFMFDIYFRKEQILISLLQLWAKSFQPWQRW